MEDRFGRLIKYLRISITDRCNLRCIYCMPPEGITSKPREEILRIEEILRVAEVALQLGINKFRLTGGEPLLRKGVIPFIKALALRPEVDDIAITTNGILLPQWQIKTPIRFTRLLTSFTQFLSYQFPLQGKLSRQSAFPIRSLWC
jgi:cyclic pyranopterin phosphate synthase